MFSRNLITQSSLNTAMNNSTHSQGVNLIKLLLTSVAIVSEVENNSYACKLQV